MNTAGDEAVTRRSVLARGAAWLAGALRLGVAGVGLAGFLAGRAPADEPDRSQDRRDRVDSYRLPDHIVPTRYDIRLEPDLDAATFTGQETIAITVRQPTREILLNAAELVVTEAAVEGDTGAYRALAEVDEATERCRLTVPEPLQPGAWRLRLAFAGTLNDKLRGFYRSTYKDQTGKTQVLAATQFEATDARRAFPCWDEPAFKAVFATTLVLPPGLTAVSNTPARAETRVRGKRVIRFADTITMSTYLVAFVVGKLEATSPVLVGKTPVRVWCVPGKRRLAAFGQRIAAFSLQFFEEYYGLPYPAEKLDLLAIPDFASGAMENLGAITFRETALLVDERTATHAELERIADVVAHENAHMWFGDLVTMAWWNGLWLNEAFATFMEMLAVDAWKPEWRRWTAFGASRAAALSVDGLHSTRPIEYPVRAPKDADAMFDVLTYEKGASVLRMLEQHLGPEGFRAGVRDYLRAHAYANADTGDLWAALARATGEPIPAMMDGWIFTPGYPLINARLDNGALVLTHQRFAYLPSPSPRASPREPQAGGAADATWQVPLQVRIATKDRTETRRLLLTDRELRLPLPGDVESVLVNEGGHGFYRVRYAPELWARLLPLVPDGLAAIDRFNLVNDAWAAAVAGLMPVPEYLEMTAQFRAERDRNVWAVLIESFAALNRIVDERERPALEALVRDRLGPAVAELGWAPKAGEDELTRQLRGDLLRVLGTLGNDAAVQARAAELDAEHQRRAGRKSPDGSADSSVDPNVLPAIVAVLAHTGDAARYEEFRRRFRSASTPQEERRYLFALAAFRPPALLEQTLGSTLTDEVRTQDAPFLIHALLMSVYGRGRAWEFLKTNWDRLDARFPKNALRRMCAGVAGLATPEWERDVRRFFAERKIDLGGKTLAQYLEQLRIAVTLRERERPALAAYLTGAARP